MRLTVLLGCYVWTAFGGVLNSAQVDAAAAPIRRTVALPPLPSQMVETLSHPSPSALKGPLQIGVGRSFEKPVVNNGANGWLKTSDGSWRWSIEIISAGALGIRLHLEDVSLPPQARFLIHSPTQSSQSKIEISGVELSGLSDYWAETIFSDRLVLECDVPADVDITQVKFKLAELSHLYMFPSAKALKEGACYSDVTCYPDWAQVATSVARMTYVAGRNTYLCTGCLLATADGSTNADYFLTARHCITSQTFASTIELYWFYQTSECNGSPPDLASVPHTTGGALIVASGIPSDFCFMRLRRHAPASAFRATWTTQLPSSGDELICLHHPDGAFKRITAGSLLGADPNFWHVQWFSGATEGGSSGAPLFNTSYQLIGQLSGGFDGGGSSCENPYAPDQFGRFDVTYTKIQRWLGGSGGTGSATVPRGTYNGLFYDQSGAVHAWNSGFVTFNTTSNGMFSGKVLSSGSQYSFHGEFDADQHSQVVLDRGRDTAWTIQLQLATDNPSLLSGSVSDGNWTVALGGYLCPSLTKTNSQRSRYTVVIPGSPGSETSPGGDSFGTATIDHGTRLRLLAALADGTRITQSVAISGDGQWPLYADSGTARATLLGWVNFSGDPTALDGNIFWLKAPGSTNSLYRDGFEINGNLQGSIYTPPARGATILNFTDGTASLAGGGLAESFSSQVTLNPNNSITDLSGNRFTMQFATAKGTFSGHARDPASGKMISFSGAVLQTQNRASGFFTSKDQSGQILVEPIQE